MFEHLSPRDGSPYFGVDGERRHYTVAFASIDLLPPASYTHPRKPRDGPGRVLTSARRTLTLKRRSG